MWRLLHVLSSVVWSQSSHMTVLRRCALWGLGQVQLYSLLLAVLTTSTRGTVMGSMRRDPHHRNVYRTSMEHGIDSDICNKLGFTGICQGQSSCYCYCFNVDAATSRPSVSAGEALRLILASFICQTEVCIRPCCLTGRFPGMTLHHIAVADMCPAL